MAYEDVPVPAAIWFAAALSISSALAVGYLAEVATVFTCGYDSPLSWKPNGLGWDGGPSVLVEHANLVGWAATFGSWPFLLLLWLFVLYVIWNSPRRTS